MLIDIADRYLRQLKVVEQYQGLLLLLDTKEAYDDYRRAKAELERLQILMSDAIAHDDVCPRCNKKKG